MTAKIRTITRSNFGSCDTVDESRLRSGCVRIWLVALYYLLFHIGIIIARRIWTQDATIWSERKHMFSFLLVWLISSFSLSYSCIDWQHILYYFLSTSSSYEKKLIRSYSNILRSYASEVILIIPDIVFYMYQLQTSLRRFFERAK